MKRTSKKPLKCGRRLAIGDVVDFRLGNAIWMPMSVSPATVNLAGLKPEDFGKTWRWIRTGKLPFCGDTVEIYTETEGWISRSVSQTTGRPIHTFGVAGFVRAFDADGEGPIWRRPQAVVTKPTEAPEPPLEIDSRIELWQADDTWRPAIVDGFYTDDMPPRRVSKASEAVRFSVEGTRGTMPLGPIRGAMRWRWPSISSAPAPKAVEPEPTIPLKDHLARLFAKNIDAAMDAVVALNRVQILRTLIIRAAHTASEAIIEQSKTPTLLPDVALTFSRNLFFASTEATEQLQKQNAAARRSVLRLDDCYKAMSEQCSFAFASAELRNFVKREVVGAKPEFAQIWEYLLRVWETVNPEIVKRARFFATADKS